MSSIVIAGDTSGSITVAAPAVAGSTTLTLPTITGTVGILVSGTAVASTSGTSIDFTNLPAGIRRITVMLNTVSLSGTALYRIQLGVAGTPETSGYTCMLSSLSAAAVTSTNSTAGFEFYGGVATYSMSGAFRLTNITGNTWVIEGCASNTTTTGFNVVVAGGKSLAGVLNMVRITTTNGTDTFDAGSINILYE